jgi:hypothetical protein
MYSKRETLYAHEIKLTSLNELEKIFKQYLQTFSVNESDKGASKQGNFLRANILERRLVALPHNSWKQIGEESFISLNEDINGKLESSGVLKIVKYARHEMVGIVFKL